MRKMLATIGATLAIVGVVGASAGPASAEDCKTYDGIRVCSPTPVKTSGQFFYLLPYIEQE